MFFIPLTLPASAALMNQSMDLQGSESEYRTPRLHMATEFPASAAMRRKRSASDLSGPTPSPVRYM